MQEGTLAAHKAYTVAVDADNSKDPNARKLYQTAIAHLEIMIKPGREKNEKALANYRKWYAAALARIEQLEFPEENKAFDTVKATGVTFDDVEGHELAKGTLELAVIMPRLHPSLFTGSRKPIRAILLYGPPGTGKTLLAKATATEAECSFFSISPGELISKWVGDSEKHVNQLFKQAEEKAPSIIFIDELESLMRKRDDSTSESMMRFISALLQLMDGMHAKKDVMVLGATNRPWDIDSAFLRRFAKRIYIPLPDLETRTKMIEVQLKGIKCELSPRDIAAKTEGFSGADIATLISNAVHVPMQELRVAKFFFREGNKLRHSTKDPPCPHCPMSLSTTIAPPKMVACKRCGAIRIAKPMKTLKDGQLCEPAVTPDHIAAAMLNTKATVDLDSLKAYDEWTRKFGEV